MQVMRSLLAAVVVIVLTTDVCFAAGPVPPRGVVDLDGEWEFATDPGNAGEREQWFLPGTALPAMPLPGYAPEANGTIQVPGIWDNQGYGTETEVLYHNAPGKGWYRRQIPIPADWTGKRIFLYIGGVSRYSRVWVNGQCFGDHIGFVSEFEYDITDNVQAGQPAFITIQVDSKQRWEVDALYGAANLADYMMSEWGGIWGHVRLEARADAWLSELFIQPKVAESKCVAIAVLNGNPGHADAVKLEVLDANGTIVAESTASLAGSVTAGQQVELAATIPNVALWSPDTPYLYRATLSLLHGSEAIDAVATGFGMREIAIDGPYILLNGKRLMLHGYGDDHIYPVEMALSSDKAMHLERLRVIKSYGFNHVRHHSTTMPPEYYEACDEVGIMPTCEFPIVYSVFLPGTGDIWKKNVPENASPEPANGTYKREWAAAIKRHRNHPSILSWVMGNEMWEGIPLRVDFQQIARELDPTRPFADTDGLFKDILNPGKDRETLDLYFLMFDVWTNPIDTPDKFQTEKPAKPVISHETGNYVTFTRPDLIDEFKHNVKPYWLTPGKEKLEQLGLLQEADVWAEKSELLYMLCHKYNIEALRKNPYIVGHHWWLFQDYWTSSNGIVDIYFRPKQAIAKEDVLKIVNDVVLLQDGLAKTYRGTTDLKVTLSVSNYSTEPLAQAMSTVRVTLGGQPLAQLDVGQGTDHSGEGIAQGSVGTLGEIVVALPDVSEPTPLRLEASLTAGGNVYTNDWSARVYPAEIPMPEFGVSVYAGETQMPYCEGFATLPIPDDASLSERAVYVTGSVDERLIDAAERGACVVMLGDGAGLFTTRVATLRTSWWKAGVNDGLKHFPVGYEKNNCGTLVYDHPVTRAMAPDGWCDDGWHALVQDGFQFVLEDAPQRPNVIIRSLPGLAAVEDKAMLFEVGIGEGSLIVSGLNHARATGSPENQWLMARLLEYAAGDSKPAVSWPASALRERALAARQKTQ